MTFGMMYRQMKPYKKSLILMAYLFTLPIQALEVKKSEQQILNLPQLLQMFSQQSQRTADFNEEKHAFYLQQPITSSGYMQFSAPNKLYKFTLQPEKISQKVDADVLEVVKNNQSQTIYLKDYPEFSIILNSIISLLAGDHTTLKKDFKITFKPTSSNWTILLKPYDDYILSYVTSIKMFGKNNKLIKIIVTEPNNDQTITHLYNHR